MTRNEGSFLVQELARRGDARRAAALAQGFDEVDALTVPLVLALARLAAQRDALKLGNAAGADG